MNWTLPSKKASSPGRVDRELALPALGRCGARRSSHRRCPTRSRASCAFAAAVAASRSSLSAAAMRRCNSRRRPFAGASLPGPPQAPAWSAPPRLPRPRSRRERRGSDRSSGAGVLLSSGRPAGGAPSSVLRVGAGGSSSPRETALHPTPPDASTPSPWAHLVPGSGAKTARRPGPESLALGRSSVARLFPSRNPSCRIRRG